MELEGRYEATPVKCMACAAVEGKQKEFASGPTDTGIHWIVKDKDFD